MLYRITYGYDRKRLMSNRGYLIELGETHLTKPEAIQKRFVRRKAEEHFGSPVKNPTQKREWYHCYFKETKEIEPGKWFVYICDPSKE